jgi:hypothetical protein
MRILTISHINLEYGRDCSTFVPWNTDPNETCYALYSLPNDFEGLVNVIQTILQVKPSMTLLIHHQLDRATCYELTKDEWGVAWLSDHSLAPDPGGENPDSLGYLIRQLPGSTSTTERPNKNITEDAITRALQQKALDMKALQEEAVRMDYLLLYTQQILFGKIQFGVPNEVIQESLACSEEDVQWILARPISDMTEAFTSRAKVALKISELSRKTGEMLVSQSNNGNTI